MSRIRVFGYPYGHDSSSASTRIRFYRVLGAMQDVDLVTRQEDADLVYIQKRAGDSTLAIVAQAKKNGQACVYDIDDAPGQCACASIEKEMMSSATLVTTDTEAKVRLFSERGFVSKIRLVPDCLDYFDEPPAYVVRPEVKTVVTYGNIHSVRAAIPFLLYLRNTFFELCFVLITGEALIEAERFRFVQWSPEATRDEVLKADIGLFCHPSDMSGLLRPATRYVTAMAAGLPSLALCSGEHSRLLEQADLSQFLFSGEDVKDRFRAFGSYNVRKSVSDKAKTYAWGNYSPAIIAAKLRIVFEEAIDVA